MAPPEEEPQEVPLQLAQAAREEVLERLSLRQEAGRFTAVDLACLPFRVDADLSDALAGLCGSLPAGASLRLAHNDLGSGTDCEQRIFDLKAERILRETDQKHHRKKKLDSSKEKDFAVSAQMRRTAEAGITQATARIEAIDEELAGLEQSKLEAPWCVLFSRMGRAVQSQIGRLDLGNCGLHATGLVMLTNTLLELEQRADGEKVSQLVLDGNDLGDISMSCLSSYVRLTGALQVLQMRNVGITDQGLSQVLSGLVGNKSVALLDLRSNGLCTPEVSKAALSGVRRFNSHAEVLLG